MPKTRVPMIKPFPFPHEIRPTKNGRGAISKPEKTLGNDFQPSHRETTISFFRKTSSRRRCCCPFTTYDVKGLIFGLLEIVNKKKKKKEENNVSNKPCFIRTLHNLTRKKFISI